MLGVPAAGHPAARTVRIDIRYSRFSPAAVGVPAGTAVHFVIVNHDPITHEFILGTPAQQLAHERSIQASHDGIPGQATLDIGETDTVNWTFGAPGTLLFACHRPGHFAYGMVGTVTAT